MNKSQVTVTHTSYGVAQASTQTKRSDGCHRTNIRLVQNVLLIWLDSNIDDYSADCRNTMTQLRRVVNTINTFTKADQCIQFLEDMSKEKVFLIVSGYLGQHIVPRIHTMCQVDSIFIFCRNKKCHEQWAKPWSKIKGVFTEISPICDALKKAARECEQNAISISIMATADASKKKLDQLDPSFMYIQIMKEILLDIDFERKHIKQYIDYCRTAFVENDLELQNIMKFEREYEGEISIWWYTLECFLYPMINRALRIIDVDIIIKMGFFIKDLHRHIEQLHNEQYHKLQTNKKFVVYRGQDISTGEFEHMTKTKGGLISFNNFLSTSKEQTVSLGFAQHALTNPDLVGILFIMTIDPSQSTTPFASITNVSCFKGEDEVLFAMQTVFRIGDIRPMDGHSRLYQVELALTSNNDKDLYQLTDCIRQETSPNSEGWYRIGLVLYDMGEFDKSEEVYQILLGQTTNESKKAPIYGQLGLANYNQGEYEEAITFYKKAIEILKKDHPSNNLSLASVYNNIGNVYDNMGEYSKALSYYEKSLEIRERSLCPDHPDLASIYNNIGNAYDNMNEYSKARSYHLKSLEIKQQSLPLNHPDLASSYNNIGNVYYDMNEYAKALCCYEKALEIQQQSLPVNHPDLAASYNNIGAVYNCIGEYAKALSYHQKSLEIKQDSLPLNHPDLAVSCNNIGWLYTCMGEYSKALSFYERAVNIGQQSLPLDHPDLQRWKNNLQDIRKEIK